jgi:excisionase family DNA binding protein
MRRALALDGLAGRVRDLEPEAAAVVVALRTAAIEHELTERGQFPRPTTATAGALLTTAECASRLGVSERTIVRRIASGRLRAERLAGRWFIHPDSARDHANRR